MNHQACIKHQAPSSICFVSNHHTTEVEALLTRQISIIFRRASFPKFEIFIFSISKHENKVWYYQSGPTSVSINPYGIPEHPKPLRNCQSLNWAQKTKKFESLKNKWEFLKSRHGCIHDYSVAILFVTEWHAVGTEGFQANFDEFFVSVVACLLAI